MSVNLQRKSASWSSSRGTASGMPMRLYFARKWTTSSTTSCKSIFMLSPINYAGDILIVCVPLYLVSLGLVGFAGDVLQLLFHVFHLVVKGGLQLLQHMRLLAFNFHLNFQIHGTVCVNLILVYWQSYLPLNRLSY